VLITDALGCTGTDSVVVPINPVSCIDPVNCFTPNSDQINDTWVIDNMTLYPDLSLTIFNKWGNLVFEQKGTYSPWDGTYDSRALPAGTYYYIINLNYLDRAPVTGTINILK
jgi:gliding motility-associated-like protein